MPAVSPPPTHVYLRVGYGWNESTNLACAIADLASSLDLSVQFVSTAAREQGVHDRWDSRVLNWDPKSPVPKSAVSLWFEPCKTDLLLAKKAGLRNILVARNPGQTHEMKSLAGICSDVVVCEPNFLPQFIGTKIARCIPAHCSVVNGGYPPRQQPNDSVWVIDSRTLRKYGYGTVQTLRLLLDFNRDLNVTLICQGSYDSATGRLIADTTRRHPTRLRVLKRASRQIRQTVYRECGWGVVLACADGGVTYLLEGFHAGLFSAALDYGGATELFQTIPGWSIACSVEYNRLGLPQAEIDHSALLSSIQTCYTQVQQDRVGLPASSLKSQLSQRRTRFESGWRELWNLH